MSRYAAEAIINALAGGQHPSTDDVLVRGTDSWAFASFSDLLDEFDFSFSRLDESATEPATVDGVTQIWSDGTDIKAKFGNGTVKTFTLT